MKKLIIATLICLGSVPAFASGKITLQNNLYNDGKTYRPMVGFGVYEKLVRSIHLNAWAGVGNQPLEVRDDVTWLVAKVQADVRFGKRITVSPGYQYKNILSMHHSEHVPYFALSYQLW
jgi:hypothetical protein